jgi:peptidoglycan/LPS O-acetylase OafA/YrhL
MGIVLGRLFLDVDFRRAWDARSVAGSIAAVLAIGAVLAASPWIPYPLLHNALLAPVFALLIVSLAAGRGPLAALLGTPLLVALGEASYSLYLIHVPLLIIWAKSVGAVVKPWLKSPAAQNASTVMLLATAVGASVVTHRFIEIPLRDVVRSQLRKRRSRAAVQA